MATDKTTGKIPFAVFFSTRVHLCFSSFWRMTLIRWMICSFNQYRIHSRTPERSLTLLVPAKRRKRATNRIGNREREKKNERTSFSLWRLKRDFWSRSEIYVELYNSQLLPLKKRLTEARTFHQTDRRAGFDVNGKRAGSAAAALKFLMLRSVLFLSFQAMTVAAKKRSEERSANQPANQPTRPN